MEAEVRDIPTNAARRPHIGIGLLTGTRRSRDQILSLVSAEDSSETAPRSLASNAVLCWLLDLFCWPTFYTWLSVLMQSRAIRFQKPVEFHFNVEAGLRATLSA